LVIEREIARQRDECRDRLGDIEGLRAAQQRDLQRDQMNDQAGGADQHEEQKPRFDKIACDLREDQSQELDANLNVELALPLLALAENVGLLGDAQRRARGGNDIQQYLE